MKKSIFGFIILSIMLSNHLYANVAVYKHCNYKGYDISLPTGNHSLNDLEQLGIKNDDLSSIKISGGYTVKAYQHDNFGGRFLTLNSSDSCLVNNNFNDVISSIKVVKNGYLGNGFWRLNSMETNKCLDLQGGKAQNRTNIKQYQCHGRANQSWQFVERNDNEFQIKVQSTNKCLDVSSKSHRNGANVHQWSCHNDSNQRWIVTKKRTNQGLRYQLKAKHSNKCLTASSNGNVIQMNCRSNDHSQLWVLQRL